MATITPYFPPVFMLKSRVSGYKFVYRRSNPINKRRDIALSTIEWFLNGRKYAN